MELFSVGSLKMIQSNCKKDPVYMARYQQREQNTPPVCWYRVVGPLKFITRRLDGKAWTSSSVDNDMLGAIVKPILPSIGSMCLPGVVFFEWLRRDGKLVYRRRVGTSAKLELLPISKIIQKDFEKCLQMKLML